MLGVVETGLSLATEVFKFLNTKESRKYLDKLVKLKQDILEEDLKGYDSDDAKLETLYKELVIIQDAAKQEMALFVAQKK